MTPADFDWQVGDIDTFVGAVRGADWSDREGAKREVLAAVKRYLPADDL